MDMTAASLLTGLVLGLVGMAMLMYGKKHQRAAPAIAGIALCVVPYLAPSVLAAWLIGSGCLAGLYIVSRHA